MTTDDRNPEAVNPERLGQWMDTQDLPGHGEPVTCSFISGGTSNVIFRVQRGDLVSVLRRPPMKVPPGRNKTMLANSVS